MVGSYSFYTNEETSDHSGETRLSPVRLSSIYAAKMPEEKFLTFKEENQEVIQIIRGEILEDKGMVKLLIMDGARPLWKYAKDSELFEDFDWLLDFYHASEHLSTLSEAIFGNDTAAAKSWYCKWRKKLKGEEGAIKGLLHSIGYYGKKTTASRKSQTDVGERERILHTKPSDHELRHLLRGRIADRERSGGGSLQEHRQSTHVPERHALAPRKWSQRPQPSCHQAIRPMAVIGLSNTP